MPPWIREIWDDYQKRMKSQQDYFLFVLQPARRSVVEDPVTENDVIDAYNLLEKSRTLNDIGVDSLVWWRIKATCSRHGILIRYEETVGGPPKWANLRCKPCSNEGLKRSCPIEELEVVVRKQLPVLEGPEQ